MFHEWCYHSPNSLNLDLAILVFRLIFLLSPFIKFVLFNKENHRWLHELKEGLILVATRAHTKKKVSKLDFKSNFLHILKTAFAQWYSKWNKHILSLNHPFYFHLYDSIDILYCKNVSKDLLFFSFNIEFDLWCKPSLFA